MESESPEINPHIYGQLIFNRGSMSIQWNKNSSISGVERTGPERAKKNETRPLIQTIDHDKLKMDKGLKHKCDNIKSQQKTGSKIAGIPHSNIFADISPRTREIKEKINK